MNQETLPGLGPIVIAADRDTWCTPRWVWEIPLRTRGARRYGLDPCSNERSTVPAFEVYMPPADGLSLPWEYATGGLVWMNPPYSDVQPWLRRARLASHGVGIAKRHPVEVWGIVPHAPNIRAWDQWGPDFAWSLGRVMFEPPEGVSVSSPTQEHDLVLWTSRDRPDVERQIPDQRPHPYRMERT